MARFLVRASAPVRLSSGAAHGGDEGVFEPLTGGGLAEAGWTLSAGDGFWHLLVASFGPDGTMTRDPVLAEGGAEDPWGDLEIAALPDGGFVVAWGEEGDWERRWSAQAFDAGGEPAGAPFEIVEDAELVRLELDATPTGFLATAVDHVPFEDDPDDWAETILLRSFDAGAEPIGPAEPISGSEMKRAVETTVGPDGTVLVHWTEGHFDFEEDDGFDAVKSYVARLDGEALEVEALFELDPARDHAILMEDERIAPIEDGRSLVVFAREEPGGWDLLHYATTLGPGGAVDTVPVRLEIPADRWDAPAPEIAMLPDGGVIAAWEDRGRDERTTALVQRFDPDGSPSGAPSRLDLSAPEGTEPLAGSAPDTLALHTLASGHVMLTWSRDPYEERGATYAQLLATEFVEGVILGGAGDDALRGTMIDDVIVAQGGDDEAHGRAGADALDGGDGDDLLHGNRGGDVMSGGSGGDRLHGGAGADRLHGDEGDDRLYGSSGSDHLAGGAGDDRLKGGSGRDVLDGGSGRDAAWGGRGRDTFVLGEGDGRLVIRDFETGRDEIHLSREVVSYFDADEIVSEFGSIRNGDAVLRFHGDEAVRIEGVTDLSLVEDALTIF